MNFLYCVTFLEPPFEGDERTQFFFTSLAAIYETFSAEQIGCKVTRLWNIGLAKGTRSYEGRTCRISREPVTSKQQQQKSPLSGDNRADGQTYEGGGEKRK